MMRQWESIMKLLQSHREYIYSNLIMSRRAGIENYDWTIVLLCGKSLTLSARRSRLWFKSSYVGFRAMEFQQRYVIYNSMVNTAC